MPYGTIKVDSIVFTNGGLDATVTVSGLNASTSGNLTVTGTVSGTTANFASGVFTTRISGVTVTGTTASFTSGIFATFSGTTVSVTSGVFASGTAAAPSVSIGTTTNGLYSSATNEVALATNSSSRLVVDASGNVNIDAGTFYVDAVNNRVGVGTANPGAGLHIATAGQTTSALDTNGSLNLLVSDTGASAGNGGSIVFGFNSGSGRFASIKGQVITGAGNSTGHLTFSTRNATSDATLTERLRITNDGLVGIGTTSPGARCQISTTNVGDVNLALSGPTADNNWGGYLTLNSNNGTTVTAGIQTSTGGMFFYYGGSERARIDSSGRLLVGTTDGSGGVSKLVVQGASNGSAVGVAQISCNGLASAALAAGTDIGYLRFTDQGSNSGVFAQITATADATTGAGDYPGRLVFSTTADGASSPTERMRIDSSGNVGLGTSSFPYATANRVCLDINGNSTSLVNLKYGNTVGLTLDTGSSSSAITAGGTLPLIFYTNSAERLRIDSSGRLLVGTTSATANGGVLQVSNGITFPATQSACSDANTLDDYEEGTWTPTVEGATTAGTATYSVRTGTYIKIGKLVSIYVALTWTGGTGTGNLRIVGLPFTPTDFSAVSFALVNDLAATTNYVPLMAQIHTNGGIFPMQALVGGNTPANANVPYDAAATMYFSGQYPA